MSTYKLMAIYVMELTYSLSPHSGEGSKTFELSFNDLGNRPGSGGPKWDCRGYGAGPDDVAFYTTGNSYETYGYYHD